MERTRICVHRLICWMPLWVGCGTPTEGKPSVELDSGEPSVNCSPELQLRTTNGSVEVGGLVQLTATGGTGEHVFALVEANSGGSVGRRTGAYVAGPVGGVADLIEVRDEGCEGASSLALQVHPELRVRPTSASIPPGTPLELELSGGSGERVCSLTTVASGGHLTDDCGYVAGSSEGTDVLEVTDTATGASERVTISVSAASALAVDGWGHVGLPVGSSWTPAVTGGTGRWELSRVEGSLEVESERVVGRSATEGVVRVSDVHAPSLFVDVPVSVHALRAPQLTRDGERSGEGVAVGLGDVDGDGHVDAALGFIEMSVDAWSSGAVALYAGRAGGLDPTPVRVLSGDDREQTFGRSVAVADLDGDGRVELLVGADRADRGATNNGLLHIYSGVAGQFFSELPSRTLVGPTPYGRLGSSVAVCDFNGDGSPDLAVGARDDADQNVAVPADKQGSVHVFLGRSGVFGDEADFVLYGVVPDGDDWVSQAGMSLGIHLAVGDLDGDGLCDLAAGAPEADDGAGAVLVWRGSSAAGEGLERTPAAYVAGPSEGELGRRLAMGDVDGDGRADLWMTAWTADLGASGGGAAWGFLSDDLPLESAEVALSAASWVRRGTSSYERLGSGIALEDLDGDGRADIILGAYRDEVGTGVNEGTVTVFAGAELSDAPTDATEATPWITLEGVDGQDRLGQAVAAIGDLTGDGVGDLLALAGYDSAHGVEVGAPYFLPAEDGAEPVLLELPGGAAGHGIGGSMAWMDVDGDGRRDLLSSAPDAGELGIGANAGQLQVWFGQSGGLSEEAEPFGGGHETHGATDRFSHAVREVGDFDGDGYADLAVVARKDGRPSSFEPTAFANPDDCPGSRTQAGAVYLFRGSPEGVSEEPAFVWFGPDAYGTVERLEGGLDRNGDGYMDLAVASTGWSVGGGVAFLYGRPAEERTVVICEAETYLADSRYDRLGSSLAALGDLDGDGCDELVVGASGEEDESGASNQGLLRLFYGTCGGIRAVTTLGLDVVGTEAGSALAGGPDMDEDGLPDLAVGASAYRAELTEVGAAWLVPGAYLLALEPDLHPEGELPEEPVVHSLLDTDGLTARMGVRGTEAGGGFGSAVAFLPPTETAPWRLAVGAPLSSGGGTDHAGAVWIFAWSASESGFEPRPWGLVVGDGLSGESGLGSSLLGPVDPDAPAWAVGVPTSDAGDLDGGAVMVLDW